LDDSQEWSVVDPCVAALRCIVTVDRNLSFQQNLDSFSIAVVVLQAKTNRLADLRPLVSSLLVAIESAVPGVPKFIGAD